MGQTNQEQIFRQQRKSSYLNIRSKLRIARDDLDIQAFAHAPDEEMGQVMTLAAELTALITKVDSIIAKGGGTN
jgi:hypothetical protein